MTYKRREIKIAKDFATFTLKHFQEFWSIDRSWNEFVKENEEPINKSWEIVSFQIGSFKNEDGISRDREYNKHIKWDVIYKHPENGFKLSRGAGFVTFQNYEYQKMLERPETYKIWQVKINDMLYNIGDIYPKFMCSHNQRIRSFFINKGDLYIETSTNGKILMK